MKAIIITVLYMSCLTANAQRQINLRDAIAKAQATYPTLKSSRLNTDMAKAMKPTAWDIGATELSSGAEEMGKGNDGIRTLISVRQNLDILTIGAKSRMLAREVNVAEAETNLLEREIARNVSIDYANAYIARKRTESYQALDSVYRDFERAAKLRYDQQATSQLEYLSAQNQARKVALSMKQAEGDLLIANQNLSRWLSADTLFTTDGEMEMAGESKGMSSALPNHQALLLADARIRLADAKTTAARAEYLPKLYAEFGSQKIGSTSGYYSYQIGLSVPIVYGAAKAKVRSAKIGRDIAAADYESERRRLASSLRQLQMELDKWRGSVEYYRSTALPLAEQQKRSAILSYREGAVTYVGFIQSMGDAMQTETDYLDAYAKYIETRFNIEYYN